MTNALRLNLAKLYDTEPESVETANTSAAPSGDVIVELRGMMCAHCEARVSQALEALPGVKRALADHAAGTVTLTLTDTPDKAAIRAAVEAAGYTYVALRRP